MSAAPEHGLTVVTCAWGGVARRVAATRRALARWRGQSLAAHLVFVELREAGAPSRYADLLPAARSTHLVLPFDAAAMRGLMEKEALLNLGARAAPVGTEILAFLDADVWSVRQDWFAAMAAPFRRGDDQELLLQVFLRATDSGEPAPKYSTGSRDDHPLRPGVERHPGLGWAMRRALWERIGGLNPWAISGSGDVLLVHELAPGAYPAWPRELMAWWPDIVRTDLPRPRLTYAPVDVVHEHHGPARDRAYWDSRKVIEWVETPVRELVELGADGLLRWRNPRHRLAALLGDKPAIVDHGLPAAAARVGLRQHEYAGREGLLPPPALLRELVRAAPDGHALVVVGAPAGKAAAFLAVEAHNANRGLRVVSAGGDGSGPTVPVDPAATAGLGDGAVGSVWIEGRRTGAAAGQVLSAWWPRLAAGGWIAADASAGEACARWAAASDVAWVRHGTSLAARKPAPGGAEG